MKYLILISLLFCNVVFASSDAKTFQDALRKNDLGAVQKLVKNNFDENQFLNEIQETPFTLTALNGNIEILTAILVPGKTKINHQTKNGWTALMFASLKSTPGGSYEQVLKKLLESGANKSLKNKQGETALDIAKKAGAKDLVKLLE